MTLFEYKTTLAKIENSNYKQLRALHKKLEEFSLTNFYVIHAINKTITRFKELTTSSIIKYKEYGKGTTSGHFYRALEQATSKEEIVSLITDFAGEKTLQLPLATNAIVNMAMILTTNDDCTILTKTKLSVNYYSVGQCNENINITLSENNRLLPSVIAYLDHIKDTAVYNYFLDHSLFVVRNWQSMQTGRDKLLENINAQIALYNKYTEALSITYTMLEKEFKKDIQP